jgi:hypothetical protein
MKSIKHLEKQRMIREGCANVAVADVPRGSKLDPKAAHESRD